MATEITELMRIRKEILRLMNAYEEALKAVTPSYGMKMNDPEVRAVQETVDAILNHVITEIDTSITKLSE